MGLRVVIELPRTEAFGVNSEEVSVWEHVGLGLGRPLPRDGSVDA